MFGSKFWPKRKSIVEKNITSANNKNIIDNDEVNGKIKDKKSKKVEKSSSIFKKFRKSFVKAKSMDNNDSSVKINNSLYKHSSDNLTSVEPLRTHKSNGLSLRRMFSSNKSRLTSAASLSETIVNDKIENQPGSPSTMITTDWRKCNVPNSKTTVKPVASVIGIINHGNTCYINSIIQCLNSIDSLVQHFVLDQYKRSLPSITDLPQSSQANYAKHKDNLSLLLSFSSLLKSLWLKDLNCNILSNDFKTKLSMTERSFRCNDQQDAQEFLLFLLNYCHETMKTSPSSSNAISDGRGHIRGKYDLSREAENISRQNQSIIHQLFVTYQQLTINCPGCGTSQYKLEPHLCLSLPVPAKTMEPLYYCFVEKDGSQICAAMWINTVSLVQYVRANIAHKFRIDVNRVQIMIVNESGFGKCFQDSEQAIDLLSSENNSQTMSNLWNGIVALEIPLAISVPSCHDYDSLESKNNQQSLKQMKSPSSPIHRTNSSNLGVSNRHSGVYDNLPLEEQILYNSLSTNGETNSDSNSRFQEDEYQRPNGIYTDNFSNNTSDSPGSPINLVITHVEEIIEKSYVSSWRRFSAPVSLLVRKEIEFKDLETIVIGQLEAVYHCNIQFKLKAHLRFWVWDGLSNTDAEITSDHQFPLLTEAVESIVSWSDSPSIIRMVAVWSRGNAARLMQTVFANLRLSHSLGRDVLKSDRYNDKDSVQSLTLMDAWSSIEENGSVELVMRATLSRRSQSADSRNISLEDCLKAYVSEEILDAKDAWKCPNCRKFQRATISNSIYALPDILVLHLKRFQSYSLSFNCVDGKSCRDHEDIVMATVGGNNSTSQSGSLLCENNSNNKLNILVEYPLSGLDMRNFLSVDALRDTPKKLNSSDYYYDLIAVCNHQGTLSTGHYTAYCRSSVDYKWRLFNDDVVKEVLADKVIQPNAYILFYQRRSSIVSVDPHWSATLNPASTQPIINPSPQSYKTPTLEERQNQTNFSKSNETKPMQRKSDPPIRRVPTYHHHHHPHHQTKKINGESQQMLLQHSSLHRPLPLDNNCNSLSNNTPIVDDDEDDETGKEEVDVESQGSTSYDEYIPASVTKRPLRLQVVRTPLADGLSGPKSH